MSKQPTEQPEGLTEEQVIGELGEWLADIYEGGADYWGQGDRDSRALWRRGDAKSLIAKLHSLGYRSPSEIQALKRAAMERVFETIEAWLIYYTGFDINDDDWQALKSKLGKGDKIKKEGEQDG